MVTRRRQNAFELKSTPSGAHLLSSGDDEDMDVLWYLKLADRYGLQISLTQIRFYISRLEGTQLVVSYSSIIRSWKTSRSWLRAIDTWFSIGAFIGLCCFFLSTAYLSYLLLCEIFNFMALFSIKSFFNVRISPEGNYKTIGEGDDVEQALSYVPYQHHVQSGITPVIPGVNIPMSHLPLFMFVLVISGIIHELGHAFAAINANVRVTGFGIFIYGIYPGAFTEIDTDELERATSAQKLRIYSAGIWHNLILALLGYFVYIFIPFLCLPLFHTGAGVLVTALHDNFSPKYGYYLSTTDVFSLTASTNRISSVGGEMACCQEFENITSASHICFQYYNEKWSTNIQTNASIKHSTQMVNFGESLGIKNRAYRANINNVNNAEKEPTTQTNFGRKLDPLSREELSFACLPAREVTEHFPCSDISPQQKDGLTCVYPAMYNGTVLLRFDVRNVSNPVIFIGQLSEARFLLNLQDLVPRSQWIPYFIPGQLELSCKYFITFSLALGLLNAVPCHGLDGQFMARTLVDYFFIGQPLYHREKIASIMIFYGTAVFALNLVIGLIKFLIIHSF
uniref:Membrane-bound transcription factor site-2 protease n=1 Tax=Panagrolaimus sp. PS1159 TaxID=55785 RepID=A0AC35F688_9BILA